MDTSAVDERAPTRTIGSWERVLGHPVAYAVTVAILLGLFAWPFLADAGRVAPTKDPAFYTWRTEVLLTETPTTLLSIEGPNGMFAAGYRVTAPVIGALLRRIPMLSSLNVTLVLMVILPVLISLLLAGFAARHLKRDPIVWHSVAFAVAGLLLTPPFVGYLDNVLCLFWLSAALYFLGPSRDSWGARIGLFVFLLLAGLTHPTTLVIFCGTLGLMAGLRLLVRKFKLQEVIRADGWMLLTGIASIVATVLIWSIGIWGPSVSLAEAALPPPYGASFFIDRMLLWIDTMRPLLNGPLFVVGLVGLLSRGWKALEDDLVRISLLWLAPLVGLFGFALGLAYPYYRFFNTTLAWVLLVGVGAGFAIRFFIDISRRGGIRRLALVGVLGVAFILATNLTNGFAISGWTKAKSQWLEPEAKQDLDVLRAALMLEDPSRAVIFVIDDEPPEPFQIYGFSKLSGNTSRYGLPPGQIDKGYLYLGSVENLLENDPTVRGDETYDDLSDSLLEDARSGYEASGQGPIIVVASIFNPAGENAVVASGEEDFSDDVLSGLEPSLEQTIKLFTLHDGDLEQWTSEGATLLRPTSQDEGGDLFHILVVLGGFILLLLPGVLALRFFVPDARFSDAVGMVPAIALGLSASVGILVVAVYPRPFGLPSAWITVVVTMALALLLRSRGPRPT